MKVNRLRLCVQGPSIAKKQCVSSMLMMVHDVISVMLESV